MVSQGYDGASVMSGNISVVQQRMKEVAPYAVYIHCCAHTLYLALVDCAKRVQVACDFFFCLRLCILFYICIQGTCNLCVKTERASS